MSAPVRSLNGSRTKATDGSGGALKAAPAPVIVNEIKLAIMAVMQELDHPVTSGELQAIWAEHKPLEVFEYHLVTLVKTKVVGVVFGPELHFRLARQKRDGRQEER